MEKNATPWIQALRRSHDRLAALTGPLTIDRLEQPSYASEWSIAQVLSHLGSQAEIFGHVLEAGLQGADPPGPDSFPPIWESWNARGPQAQATDALRHDATTVERFEALTAEQRDRFHVALFGMDLDAAGLARLRLGEHAVHTWDIAVALDPTATVAPDAVSLLVDSLDLLVPRVGRPDGSARSVAVVTSDPERHFLLAVGDGVELADAEQARPAAGELRLPAEALVRLVYGRLDPDHVPDVGAEGVTVDELRGIFPGM